MSTTESLRELLELLERIASGTSVDSTDVSAVQGLIWSLQGEWGSESAREILRDLAYDLEFFVADTNARAESDSYYGPTRALEEIRAAVSKLRCIEM